MIDLHTHTTASDGRDPPEALVARAAEAGVDILSVTDHDTVTGCAPAAAAAAALGVRLITGIEITAVLGGADVHVLGYFIDSRCATLLEFLAEQRLQRIGRIRQIVARLAGFGIRVDAEAIVAPALADAGKAAGRPWVARALIEAGYVETVNEAFERWLGRGRPAFVPRLGVPPATVIERVHEAGGLASLAHPGLARCDEHIQSFVDAGLDAIEVYHSRHDGETTARYRALAGRLGVGISGGSDYHGDRAHAVAALGSVSLPRAAFDDLEARAAAVRQ